MRPPFLRIGVVGLALLSCCIGMALGHESPDAVAPVDDLTEMSLEQLMQVDVVYAASKYEQKISDAPASVTIITRDEIERFGYRTLGDVLRAARGFYTTYDRSYSYLGTRGFGRPGDYNTCVLLMIDWHRLNDNIFDASSIGTEFHLDVEMIERVEVVRGPSSSIYGTNALLGVINVINRDVDAVKGLEAGAAYGSYSTSEGRLA